MLSHKVSKQTRSEAIKNNVIIKRISNISKMKKKKKQKKKMKIY